MDKGLLQLLDVIGNNPHDPVLARRFIALISELDQNTKEEAMLRLADIQLETVPLESLRLAKLVYNENPRNVYALEIVQRCMRSLGKFAKAEIIGIEIEKVKSGKGPTTLEARREQVAMIEKLTSTNLNPRQVVEESQTETEVAPPTPPPVERKAPQVAAPTARSPVQARKPEPLPPPPVEIEDEEDFEKDSDDIFNSNGDMDTEFMGNMDDDESPVSGEMTFQPPNMEDDGDYDLSFDEIPISPGRREPLINTSSPASTSIALDETEVVPPPAQRAPQRAQSQPVPQQPIQQQKAPQPISQQAKRPEPTPVPAPEPEQNYTISLEPDLLPDPISKSPQRLDQAAAAPIAQTPVSSSQWQQPRSQPAEQSKSWLNVLSKIRSRKPTEVEPEKKPVNAPKSIPVAARPEVAHVPAATPPPPASSAAINSGSNPNLASGAPRKMPTTSRPLFSGEFLFEIFQLNRSLDVEKLRAKSLAAVKMRPAPAFEPDVLKALMAKLESISEDHIRWELLAGLWGGQANGDTLAIIKKYNLSHKSCGMWGLYLDSLLAVGDGRKALFEIYKTLKAKNSLAWAEVAWARLPAVWDRLKVWGHTWQAEEGVPKLIELVERRRPPKFSSFAAQDRAGPPPLAKSA